jgi:histone deacetylase HOS2
MSMHSPRKATEAELAAYHGSNYLDFLKRYVLFDRRGDSLTPNRALPSTTDVEALSPLGLVDDCPLFDRVFSFCQQYAGASLAAARKLGNEATDIAINWSGGLHHAKKNNASGFCYVNDIVLAILELLR